MLKVGQFFNFVDDEKKKKKKKKDVAKAKQLAILKAKLMEKKKKDTAEAKVMVKWIKEKKRTK